VVAGVLQRHGPLTAGAFSSGSAWGVVGLALVFGAVSPPLTPSAFEPGSLPTCRGGAGTSRPSSGARGGPPASRTSVRPARAAGRAADRGTRAGRPRARGARRRSGRRR